MAFAMVCAGPEEIFHGVDHGLGALPTLGLALWQQVEVLDLCRGEQLCGGVRACGDTCATTDACRGVHREVGCFLGNRCQVRIRGRAGGDGDVAADVLDAVHSRTAYRQVLDDREASSAEWFDRDVIAVLERAHM